MGVPNSDYLGSRNYSSWRRRARTPRACTTGWTRRAVRADPPPGGERHATYLRSWTPATWPHRPDSWPARRAWAPSLSGP